MDLYHQAVNIISKSSLSIELVSFGLIVVYAIQYRLVTHRYVAPLDEVPLVWCLTPLVLHASGTF